MRAHTLQEALHRLCPDYATEINSPLRHVRTRVYFTSESHMHSLINVLRFCTLGAVLAAPGLLDHSSARHVLMPWLLLRGSSHFLQHARALVVTASRRRFARWVIESG